MQTEDERGTKYRLVSSLVTVMWIGSIASNFVAMYFNSQAEAALRLHHFNKGIQLLSKVLLTQIVGNLFWFGIGCWILASSVMGEKEPLDIAAGGFFFLSGVFDLVLSVALFSLRSKLLYTLRHLPALSVQKVNSIILAEQVKYMYFVNICYPGTIGSLGMAFFCLGLYYIRFTMGVTDGLALSNASPKLSQVKSGVRRIRMGAACYIILAVSQLLQAFTFIGVLPPVIPTGLFSVTFFLWIIGMLLVRSGGKKMNQVIKEEGKEENSQFPKKFL